MDKIWKPIDTMPFGILVIVYEGFGGFHLREKTAGGYYYDENNNLDDSGIEFEWWTELPNRPKE